MTPNKETSKEESKKKQEKKETNKTEKPQEKDNNKNNKTEKMNVVIRIKGQVGIKRKLVEGLKRLGLNTKYSCVVLKGNQAEKGMLKRLRDYLAYGEISEEDFKELLEKRSKVVNGNEKKPSSDEIIKGFNKGKKLKEMNIQPVFRLHPPRKGIKSKQRYPQGVLGYHGEKINELLKRML
ncbi:MAG TPA: uL30 family ribosomal protein [Candidatus Nanoarchaeia archaeon]|nr:uL30 family ribosomal protein [Candidatus Nanoarchaeia archaeon]